MQVYFDTLASAAERAEVDEWCESNDSPDVEYISIDKPAVFVHGSRSGFEAVIGRAQRRGKLTEELTEALASMRAAAMASHGDT